MENTTTKKMLTVRCEATDTFGGQANYSWVRREQFEVPYETSHLAIVRKAKLLLGYTGARCQRSDFGDTIELRPYGRCQVIFISW